MQIDAEVRGRINMRWKFRKTNIYIQLFLSKLVQTVVIDPYLNLSFAKIKDYANTERLRYIRWC